MAYGSANQGSNRGLQTETPSPLKDLLNPFSMTTKFVSGGIRSVDDILRGLGRAGGAILSDVIAEPVRGLLPGGDPGWWRDEEDGAFRPSTYKDVLLPIGKSFANTVDMLGDVTYLTNLSPGWDDGGVGRANEQFVDRLTQFAEDPFNFTLEHVGNAALVGGLAAKPAQLGTAASRGAVTGAQAAQGLRPLAGRGIRAAARQATEEAAQAGSRSARASLIAEDVVGHPYRTAARKVGGSRAAQLIRDPRAFDPVTKVAETIDNVGEAVPTTKLYRGMAEEFDPARVPSSGTRFTDDLDYALSNTNEGRHPFLYEVEVPESRIDIGTSDFADLMGESAGPRGARLGIDELGGLRQVDPETLQPIEVSEALKDWRYSVTQRDMTPEQIDILTQEALKSPVQQGPFYRGLDPSHQYPRVRGTKIDFENIQVGQELDFPASSWTKDYGDASDFGSVVLETPSGRGISYDGMEYATELVGAGKFKVAEVVKRGDKTHVVLEPIEPAGMLNTTVDLPEQLTRTKVVGTSTDPAHQLGIVDQVAQSVGYALEGVKKSDGYQNIFGSEARAGRQIRSDLREGKFTGMGRVADAVREKFFDKKTPLGDVNVRRKWDPSRVERLLLRDLKNLRKRPDADQYQGLIDDLDFDQVSPRDVPGRVAAVATGGRVVGQTLTPEGLLGRINRVMEEVQRRSSGPEDFGQILEEMLPGVDAMGLYLLGLNAVEKARGLPENSLTSALSDYVSLDRFADTNRRAQAALRGTEFDTSSATTSRFRLPEDELGVDINALPDEAQQMFYGAAEQYRRELASSREPMLVEEGVIPSAGSRVGLSADQPTQFPTELADMPLSKDWRARIRAAEKNVDQQQRLVDEVRDRLTELGTSGRALYKPKKGGGVYRTQTGEALRRHTAKLNREAKKLETAKRKLAEVEDAARVAVENAPVSARNYLTYATRVAPEQAKALRAMADEGVGDPAAYRALADELDAIPKSIEDLNSAEVYLSYLKDMKDRGLGGENRISSKSPLDTRQPSGTRRRGTETDVDYSRDFRARAYWQDAEFQSWFMARQADDFVRTQGLAKKGSTRLREAGFSAQEIADMTPAQAQQALERLGLRVYQPDQLFGTGRKPVAGSSLDAEWITPFAERNLMGAIEKPNNFERVFGEGIWDPAIRAWKVFALPLRLGWQVNNIAGNALLTTLVGQVSPFDYPKLMKASWNAVHDWNRGITSQVRIPLTDTYRAHLTAALQKADDVQRGHIQNMLDQDAIVLTNELLNEISSSGLTKGDFAWLNNSQFLRDIGAGRSQNVLQQFGVEVPQIPGQVGERLRNVKQTGREVVDMAYHINEAADNLHRTVIYLDQIGKGVSHADAMTQVVKALGDYNKLSQFERRVIKRVYPFYPWMRHITEVVTRGLAPDNITRSLIFTHLTNIMGEPGEWEALLPEWASGHIYMGMDDSGKPEFLSTRGLNPFLDVFDPVAQPNMRGLLRPSAPPIQFLYEQMSGTSVLTGKPFSSPDTPYGSNELARPPVGEYLFRNVPQAGAVRDIYRDLMGQPLTRYGTGEAAFFEGAEEGRSSLQDIQQLFGYNVRPLDVEQMRERELLQEFRAEEQAAKYQEQLAQRGGRQARDLLNALPGLGG